MQLIPVRPTLTENLFISIGYQRLKHYMFIYIKEMKFEKKIKGQINFSN